MTGAAILVALMVLLVPELLSGPRHPARQAPMTSEPPIRSYTLPLADGSAGGAGAASASGAIPAPNGAEAVTAPAVTAPAVEAATAEHPAAQAVAGGASADGGTAPAVAGHGTRSSAPAVAGHGTRSSAPAAVGHGGRSSAPAAVGHGGRSSAPAASAHAVPRSAPASMMHAASRRGWFVQVGSFGNRGNADRLVHELKRKGYGAFVSETSSRGRKWYRVRVGPAPDRAAAVAIARRLHTAGHAGEVLPLR